MTYQPYQGERGCRAIPVERTWELIEPHLQPGWTVFDVGADLGWFTRKAADLGCLPLSFEQDETAVERAVEMADGRDMVIARHRLELDDMRRYARAANTVDAILALNVLHYLDWRTAAKWVRYAGQFAHTLIVEMPNTTEPTTIGCIFHDRIDRLLRFGYSDVRLLGSNEVGPTHYRQVWLARNRALKRADLLSVWTHAEGERLEPRHSVEYDGRDFWLSKMWRAGRRKMFRGFSVDTLLNFDVRYPSREWWVATADRAVRAQAKTARQIDNVHPSSLIWCGDRIRVIDCEGDEPRWEQDLDRTKRVLGEWSQETSIRLFRNRWPAGDPRGGDES